MPITRLQLVREQERIFMAEVHRWIGAPYKWGGQGQLQADGWLGLDCSGLITEGARACGIIPKRADYSADGYWVMWKDRQIPEARYGSLAFWFDGTGRAIHVAVCVGPAHCITADGGGASVTSLEAAQEKEAVIRYLPIEHGRKTQPRFVYPWQ